MCDSLVSDLSPGWKGAEEIFAAEDGFEVQGSARIARKLPFKQLLDNETFFRHAGSKISSVMSDVLLSGVTVSRMSDSMQTVCAPVFREEDGMGREAGIFALISIVRDGAEGAFPFTEIDTYVLENIAALAYKDMKRCHRLDEVRYGISVAAERRDEGLKHLADTLRQRPALFPGERSSSIQLVSEGVSSSG